MKYQTLGTSRTQQLTCKTENILKQNLMVSKLR
jgi:hypothetical protein